MQSWPLWSSKDAHDVSRAQVFRWQTKYHEAVDHYVKSKKLNKVAALRGALGPAGLFLGILSTWL